MLWGGNEGLTGLWGAVKWGLHCLKMVHKTSTPNTQTQPHSSHKIQTVQIETFHWVLPTKFKEESYTDCTQQQQQQQKKKNQNYLLTPPIKDQDKYFLNRELLVLLKCPINIAKSSQIITFSSNCFAACLRKTIIIIICRHTPMRSRCCIRWAEIFVLKKLPGGKLCANCARKNHRSTSSLRYHLSAKHVAASTDNAPSLSRQCHKSTLNKMTGFRAKMTNVKSTTDKLTSGLQWSVGHSQCIIIVFIHIALYVNSQCWK